MKIINPIKLCLFLILAVCSLNFLSCKKDYAKKVSGNYMFITKSKKWSDTPVGTWDTIIYFTGTISEESKNILKIIYAPNIPYSLKVYVPGTIKPEIKKDGTLDYPDFVVAPTLFFSGQVMDNGDIEMFFGDGENGGGWSNKITGRKI